MRVMGSDNEMSDTRFMGSLGGGQYKVDEARTEGPPFGTDWRYQGHTLLHRQQASILHNVSLGFPLLSLPCFPN